MGLHRHEHSLKLLERQLAQRWVLLRIGDIHHRLNRTNCYHELL